MPTFASWLTIATAVRMAMAVPRWHPSIADLKPFGDGTLTMPPAAGARLVRCNNETDVFEHTVADPGPGRAAAMTFMYLLSGKESYGRYIADNIILRYYLDGSHTPSLEFKAGAAAGTFVHLEDPSYYATGWNASKKGPGGERSHVSH